MMRRSVVFLCAPPQWRGVRRGGEYTERRTSSGGAPSPLRFAFSSLFYGGWRRRLLLPTPVTHLHPYRTAIRSQSSRSNHPTGSSSTAESHSGAESTPRVPRTPFTDFTTTSEDTLRELGQPIPGAGRGPGGSGGGFHPFRHARMHPPKEAPGVYRSLDDVPLRSAAATIIKPTYRNRFTAFFFKELDKGLGSPYVVILCGVLGSVLTYKILLRAVASREERLRQLHPRSKVPMNACHEAMWGFSTPSVAGGEEGDTVELSRPGAAIFDPAVAVAEAEPLLHRPRLIHSEVLRSPVAQGDTIPTEDEVSMVMEMPEFDRRTKNDVYYRSLHYMRVPAASPRGREESVEGKEEQAVARRDSLWTSLLSPWSSNGTSSSSSAAAGTDHDVHSYRPEEDDYFRYMPGNGQEHIHGLVKCKLNPLDVKQLDGQDGAEAGVLPCVPYPGDLARELSRKLLLSLGPVHILQDPSKHILPVRFSRLKQPDVRTLVIGLRGGELPRWLSSAYPNFVVDVVEPDLSLIRTVKKLLGFQEHATLTLCPMNPLTFIREKAAQVESAVTANETSLKLRSLFIPWKRAPTSRHSAGLDAALNKRGEHYNPVEDPRPYDLILIDALDHQGRLPTYFARLDFIQQLRHALSPTGVVAVAVPNHDANYLYHVVQHWRLGFPGRSTVLAHCAQEPATVLMTFQDEGGRGQSSIGSIHNTAEMKDIVRTHLTQYGADRVPAFDLTKEVDGGGTLLRQRRQQPPPQDRETSGASSSRFSRGNTKSLEESSATPGAVEKDSSEGFFKVLEPGRRYTVKDYLPPGHPVRRVEELQALGLYTAHRGETWWWHRLARWASAPGKGTGDRQA